MSSHDDFLAVREAPKNGRRFSAERITDHLFANECALSYVHVGSG